MNTERFQPGDICEYRFDPEDNLGGQRVEILEWVEADGSYRVHYLPPYNERWRRDGYEVDEKHHELIFVERPSKILTSRSSWQ